MTTSTITALTAAGALAGTEPIETVQGGVSKKTTVAAIAGLATAATVGLGSVTNDAQTKAALVPNTTPSAGQMFVGNAGGTAFTVVSMSGDATITSAGVITVAQAAKLTTPRAINGTNFDGSAPITITAQHPSSVFASLPAAAGVSGQTYLVTDVGESPGTYLISNGTRWKPVNGRARLKTLGAAVSAISNVETIVTQAALPAALLAANDGFEVHYFGNKSGATDTFNLTVRMGTAGTTADTSLQGANSGAAALSIGGRVGWKVASATSVQRDGQGLSDWNTANAVAAPAPTTISNISNALFITATIKSSSTTNTVGMAQAYIDWVTN
jgi:hypothetical protein